MVSVTEILQKVKTTCDGYLPGSDFREWARMISTKLADGQTPAIMRAINRYGFTDPICITVKGSETWELGNGHHRLSLAILLGLDEIPVDFSDWYSRSSTTNDYRIWDDHQTEDKALAGWISAVVEKTL